MVLMVIYRATLIRLCQTNTRLKDDILDYIFCKQNLVIHQSCQKLYLKMSEIPEEIRYVMLFYYKKGKNAAQTCRKICEVYDANAVNERRT